MSKNNHILTSDGKIICVPEDTLCHWKYFRKVKVDGKWRYYYKDNDSLVRRADKEIEIDLEPENNPKLSPVQKLAYKEVRERREKAERQAEQLSTTLKTAKRYVEKYMSIKIKDLFNGKYQKDHASGEYSWNQAKEDVKNGWPWR